MTTSALTQLELRQFSGTEQYFKSSIFTSQMIHTDGVQYVVENGAGWLVDLVASHLKSVARWTFNSGGFAVVILRKNKTGNGAKVRMSDGNGNEKTLQAVRYTDFPFVAGEFDNNEFKMFVQWDETNKRLIMMLPSEY